MGSRSKAARSRARKMVRNAKDGIINGAKHPVESPALLMATIVLCECSGCAAYGGRYDGGYGGSGGVGGVGGSSGTGGHGGTGASGGTGGYDGGDIPIVHVGGTSGDYRSVFGGGGSPASDAAGDAVGADADLDAGPSDADAD